MNFWKLKSGLNQFAEALPLADAEAEARTSADAIISWILPRYIWALWLPSTAFAWAARITISAFCSASRLAYAWYECSTAAYISAFAWAFALSKASTFSSNFSSASASSI